MHIYATILRIKHCSNPSPFSTDPLSVLVLQNPNDVSFDAASDQYVNQLISRNSSGRLNQTALVEHV